MDERPGRSAMTERENPVARLFAEEGARLRNFIRRRVPNEEDAEDLLQDVFYEVTVASRLAEPIERWGAWMFRVARNRIIDLFRKKKMETLSSRVVGVSEEGEELLLEEVLPSPDAGPEAQYARAVLLEEIEGAIEELPKEQREVFVAHEIEGYSFQEIAERTGVSVNTLLSRKHYAVIFLRKRLEAIHNEFAKERGGRP
jgi:RNA polymerase sigma factor (sigma-70 family)